MGEAQRFRIVIFRRMISKDRYHDNKHVRI